jgi:predicted chitinase
MKKLTVQEIRKIFKRNNLDEKFCLELSRLLSEFGDIFKIDTEIRRVRFLAQAVHETGVMRNGEVRVRENLNYSTNGLIRISRFFRTHRKLALKHGRNKYHKANVVAIANLMYADKNRAKNLRLGNDKDGDGFLYRGAGLFQTTGKENMSNDIRQIEKLMNIRIKDEHGKLYNGVLDNYTMSILLGMAHWHRTGMWKLNSTNAITNKINRGLPSSMKRERLATAIRVKKILIA